jgi:predicted nucleic acid-binding protein
VWNFVLEEDRPERRAITEQFFQQVPAVGHLYISEVVLQEVECAPLERRAALDRVIERYAPVVLRVTEEAQALAERYLQEGLIPLKYRNDALHLATAVVHDVDVLVSWNFEHIVKLKTRMGVNGVSRILGYREIEILSPEEVDLS